MCAAGGVHILHFESQRYASEPAPLIQAIGKISLVSGRQFAASGLLPSNKVFGHDEKWLPWVGEGPPPHAAVSMPVLYSRSFTNLQCQPAKKGTS